MTNLNDFAVFDLSGGVRRDRSNFQLADNEVPRAWNFEFRDKGRVKRRRGFQQMGQNTGFVPDNIFTFIRDTTGNVAVRTYTIERGNSSSSPTLRVLRGTRLTAAVAITDTTITVDSTGGFANTGADTMEIDGDLITYTGVTATTFTGCGGILTTHASGRAVHQWVNIATTNGPVSNMGVYDVIASTSPTVTTRMNNVLMLLGAGTTGWSIDNNDAETETNLTSQGSGIGATVYRDRIYIAGSGGVNFSTRQIFFSNRAVGTTWTNTTDYFVVPDSQGDFVTGLHVLNDVLWIFKLNSTFGYDEVELKQRQFNVGAYNHRVIQEHAGLIYTFCPSGIYVTNGFTTKNIGEPVKQFWKNFKPVYENESSTPPIPDRRVITNTFAAIFEEKYYLYIGDITDPETQTDVMLAYDIRNNAWEAHHGFTDFTFLKTLQTFRFGDIHQQFEGLFGGPTFSSTGAVVRLFENRYLDNQSSGSTQTRTLQGTDIYVDDVRNSGGTAINAVLETKMYHFNVPQLLKTVGRVRFMAENPGFTLSVRVQDQEGFSRWHSLGTTRSPNESFRIPANLKGYNWGLQISYGDPNSSGVFNGFIFEDINATRE